MSASKIVLFFLMLALFFTSIGGIVVASVLKEMDNVVKVKKNEIVCLCKTPGSWNDFSVSQSPLGFDLDFGLGLDNKNLHFNLDCLYFTFRNTATP